MLYRSICYGMHLDLDRLSTRRIDPSGYGFQIRLGGLGHGFGLRRGVIL
ncbi:hypothetical protein A0J51_00693 [Gluconobacter japonicus]|nr:hypothetical protein A0J51_00693 [Gluconobacter japonicus]